MDPTSKTSLSSRLRRIEGQVAGVQRMVEDDRYCIDVLVQISAARAALAKVSRLLLESHMNHCVRRAFESEDDAIRTEMIDELVHLFEKNCSC